MEDEDDLPVPPAKGYNLDFLDQLDDPNFNPFETKTAIKDTFGESKADTSAKPAAPADQSSNETSSKEPEVTKPADDEAKPKEKAPAKRPPVRKPWLKKKTLKTPARQPPSAEAEPVADEACESSSPPPPAKGYNLDFLANLDDPNFDPFKTKTAIKDNFGTSSLAAADSSNVDNGDVTLSVPETSQPGAQTVDEKSGLIKNESADSLHAEVADKEDKVSAEAEKKKKPLPKKPWLKKRGVKPKPPTAAVASEEAPLAEEADAPLPPAKGYNLDFLNNLDDPNFNPFETKTAVKATFDSSEPSAATATAAVNNSSNIIENAADKWEKSANIASPESCNNPRYNFLFLKSSRIQLMWHTYGRHLL